MEDGVSTEENKIVKMGATSQSNATRLVALQERCQNIKETLAKRNQELRQLCIQEAELTGIMPTEIPLEPGESPPVFRRRVGTSFQLPQNLVNSLNSEEESITLIELNMQVQANMAEAVLSLANESKISKTIRRKHMARYQCHKRQYNCLEEKLTFIKTRTQMAQLPHLPLQQQKQKKKPRPVEQDDNISISMSIQQPEPFTKSVLRHSMRSLQHPYSGEGSVELRGSVNHQKLAYRNSEGSPHTDLSSPLVRPEDAIVSGIYRLSLDGYSTYMERKESGHLSNQHMPSHFIPSQSNPNLYHHQPYPQTMSHTLTRGSQQRTQPVHGCIIYPQYSPNILQSQSLHDCSKYSVSSAHTHNGTRQANSPGSSSHASSYLKSPYYSTILYPNSRHYANTEQQFKTLNPHQIQPHQQYDHDVMTAAGLGGYWKTTESGELVWCNSAPSDSLQRDKRFGSLDRRRNKRVQKRTSPLVDPKSATISVAMPYCEPARHVPQKNQQLGSRNRLDNRQLVRTQSLGSVGAQTVDSVWPSDDNSSCGSDAHSINDLNIATRKPKQKEWFETSLDGPAPLTPTRSHSTVSSTLAPTVPSISPEEQYTDTSTRSLPSPQHHKPPLEIPAESHPSPTIHEPNMALFNNNILKHGTLIQAGHCRPYHEETKPFEMSDFYKYSTKFKKSPIKHGEHLKVSTAGNSGFARSLSPASSLQRNLSQNFEDDNSVIQKGMYLPLQPMKCQPFSPNNNYVRNVENVENLNSMNTSLDLSQLTSNVAENFSAEMNAWYKNQEQQIDNNNSGRQSSSRSTATLV